MDIFVVFIYAIKYTKFIFVIESFFFYLLLFNFILGDLIATGSLGGHVSVWSLKDGSMVMHLSMYYLS